MEAFLILTIGFIGLLMVFKGIKIVPQQQAWVVERFGSFEMILEPGLNFLNPITKKVAYRHSLKEFAHEVQEQPAITRDNVTMMMDGVLYLRIIDPQQASYGVSNPIYAVSQLAQTTMRSEIGKLSLDQCFEEREQLNANIVSAINQASQTWGIQCMRYEIKNITPPSSVLKAMELQVAAERQKRAEILQSEGLRQSKINMAEGAKQEVVLNSEAALTDQVNRAKGEAEAIIAVAEATAKGIELIAAAIARPSGEDAIALRIAEQYVGAFEKLARNSTTMLLPANANDTGSMVAQAMTVFESIKQGRGQSKDATKSAPWGNKN
jgi:regulator of protease activity HflC (stomatin/prohibitin superfamily)